MGKCTLDEINMKVFCDLGPGLSHLLVRVAGTDELGCHFRAHVTCVHQISKLFANRIIWRKSRPNANRVAHYGNKA